LAVLAGPPVLSSGRKLAGKRTVVAMSRPLDDLLTPQEREAVDVFVEALQRQYPDRVRDVILFGSKARGDSRPDSDIDLLILVDDDHWRFSHAISRIAARVSLKYDVLLGPRVIRQARWGRSVLYSAVSAEGIPLASAH
jgi:predicted nucleotidyltransferase